jgi:hypothetical protein
LVKNLRLYRDGTVSVVQLPHLNQGFVHVLATPTRSGLLYYVGHRKNRRTRTLAVLAGGFRTREKAFAALSRQIRSVRDIEPKHDPMAKKAYLWEDTHVGPCFQHERLTQQQMLELIYRVCGDFKVDPPEVYFIRNANFCYLARCANGRPFLIMSEQVHFVNTAVILHEIAHYLADLVSPNLDNHGPIWLREYLRLLTTYTTLTLNDLLPSLRQSKLRYWLPKP